MSYKLLAWDQVLILDHMTFLSIMSHFCKTQFSAAAAGIKSKCQVKINMEEEMRKEITNVISMLEKAMQGQRGTHPVHK